MFHVLEVNPKGGLQIPPEVLPHIEQHTRYQLEIDGETLILRPQKDEPFWAKATPAQRVAQFREWIGQTNRPPAPILPDEAFSRETIYN